MKQRVSELIKPHNDSQYTPIKSLNTFLFDWKIKARVTKKHQMRNYTNARGAGHILKIELIDNQGTQIEGTFFNEQALTNNSTLEENKVYLISGGQIKIANKKFTSISNDFCITFDKNTTIEEASDDESIGAQGFCFVSID